MTKQTQKKELVLAVTGASGAIYPKLFLDELRSHPECNVQVVATPNALRIFKEELNLDLRDYWPKVYHHNTFDVPFVSGSAKLDAMIILPCSTGTLGRIAAGISNDNITRGADVFLKERRQLIVAPRETPLSQIHLNNMLTLSQAGATIIPAMPSFYHKPKTLEEAAFSVVSRILDHLGIDHKPLCRWMQDDE